VFRVCTFGYVCTAVGTTRYSTCNRLIPATFRDDVVLLVVGSVMVRPKQGTVDSITRDATETLDARQGQDDEANVSSSAVESTDDTSFDTEKLKGNDDVAFSERPATPPPPPALGVQSRLDLHAQPGAFRVAPGRSFDAQSSQDEDELDGDEPEVHASSNQDSRGVDFDGEYLVEADLVQELVFERPAEPVPTMLVEAQPLRRWTWSIATGLLAVSIFSIAVGVSLGVVLPRNSAGTTSSAQLPATVSSQPSTTPSSYPSMGPSPTPTQTPSAVPSTMPSSMPTPISLRMLRDSLPSFTNDHLRNESSSQSMALEWIAKKDRERSSLRRMTQRFALATFHFATSGAKWKQNDGWLNSTQNECKWFGCSCTENGTIAGLVLESNGLFGTMPDELSLLKGLKSLQLSENQGLQGTLTPEIGSLTALQIVNLYATNITGHLPTDIGRLTQLTELSVSFSRISGAIPTEIGLLASLTDLGLFGTGLVGKIPNSVGLLSNLRFFDAGNNKLSSTIPAEIGFMSSLTYINLADNLLTGPIPAVLLPASPLDDVVLSDNFLNGSIPTTIGQAMRLSYLTLDGNNLNGQIPTEIGRLSSLIRLFLYDNALSGTIPTQLGSLTNLDGKGLSLDQNMLTGTLPTELGRLSNVQNMDFFQNQLRGSVPTELCALVSKGLDLELECDKVVCNCTLKCNCWNETAL
jgi:Leucine-rich repeat (LRR) protein